MTQLKLQLHDAAEREARRGPVGRVAATARTNGTRPLLAVGALAALAVCVVLAVGALRQAPRPHEAGLRVLTRLDLTSGGGQLATGLGAVWASDPGGGDVLRVAPDSGRVLARIHTGGEPHAIATAAGAVWTYDFGRARLVRIDPATGRVTARLALGLPPRGDAGLVVLDGRLWAGDEARLLRIDPAGRRIERRVSVRAGGLEASGMTADGRRVYALDRDGRLLTIDGRNATKGAPVALHVPARWLAGAAGRSVIVALDGGFAAVDRTTGRTLWQTRVAARSFDAAAVAGTALWAHGSAPSGRDTVWRLDARSGRVTGRLALPEFGVSSETAVRGHLWVLTPGGRLQIVSGG